MDHFSYQNGNLFAENVKIETIAKKIGTPVYIYSKATFIEHFQKMQRAFSEIDTTICYSVKACGNINILKFMAQAGSGFDIVSGGELFRVQQAGGDTSKTVFAGVGKTDNEIIDAMNAGIGYFNIESQEELENLITIAEKQGKKTKAALRINPDVQYKTHAYITTGVKETKFGVDIEHAINIFDKYAGNKNVNLCAVHVHLGSGGKTIEPYVNAVKKILPVIDELRTCGHKVEMLDLGGGYGADYESDTVPSAQQYADGIVPLLKDRKLKLILEPGKSICANAGILLSRIIYTKQGGSKNFAIVDAGMNDLIRPSLYDAFHFIWPAKVNEEFVPSQREKDFQLDGTEIYDVVGPICEGADFLAKDRALPPVKRDDLLAVFTAGAYGFTMSSNYNARCRAAEVLVDGENFSIIRKRETYEDLIALEK
ncbi:MAG: diaminopimelate decarboxylase [Sedimentisphaerales bacterium]|nr:diaminopimelate decarboxylase [Sedimentisphaerales bacterium]